MEKVFDWFSTPFERFIHQERASGLLLLVFTGHPATCGLPVFVTEWTYKRPRYGGEYA